MVPIVLLIILHLNLYETPQNKIMNILFCVVFMGQSMFSKKGP